ncbi:MAG: serine aminopeptidase domain-containing protein [Acidobacteriota bacterium]
MKAFRFGPPGQQLFGVLHTREAQTDTPLAAPLGAVLCNPLGQEAVRIHRFYRVLADRLAQLGIPTLRFDYFGTGDSDGDDLDGDLSRWACDVELAQQALHERALCQRIVWFGARLGGTVAVMASTQASQPPALLALWEPVVAGPAYLRQLARDHVALVASPYRPPEPAPGPEPDGEALGLALSASLMDQIRQLPQGLLAQARCDELIVVSEAAPAPHQAGPDQAGPLHRHLPLHVPFDWTSEEALNTALVPPAALQLLTQTLQGYAR